MLSRMRENLSVFWKRTYAATLTLLPALSEAEQTKATWAIWIRSFDEVPELYRDFFAPILAQGYGFPYTLLTPAYEHLMRKTTEKIICEFGGDIYILERSGDSYEARCYSREALEYVEFSRMLLDASLTLHGRTRPGVQASSSLHFNSVTDYLFTPLLKSLRGASHEPGEEVQPEPNTHFEQWGRAHLKFMNFARRSLLPGEQVEQAILQPEIRTRVITILGKSWYRTLSPAHMLILTERELILFREKVWPGAQDRYGGIWDYIPRHKILGLTLKEKDGALLELFIRLQAGHQLEFLFQAPARQQVEQLVARFAEH